MELLLRAGTLYVRQELSADENNRFSLDLRICITSGSSVLRRRRCRTCVGGHEVAERDSNEGHIGARNEVSGSLDPINKQTPS